MRARVASGNREGTYVNLWLILAVVWQKPVQYCRAIVLQLKINAFKRRRPWVSAAKLKKQPLWTRVLCHQRAPMEEMYALDLEAFKTSQLLSFSLTELVLSDLLYFDFHIDFPTEVKLN